MKKALAHSAASQPEHAPITGRVRLAGGLAVIGLIAGLGLFASRPAHTAGGPIAVSVANTPLAVINQDSDNPARHAVGNTVTFTDQDGGKLTGTLYTVPVNKRLVIEHLSSSSNTYNDANGYDILVITLQGGGNVDTYFNQVPDAAPYSAASQAIRLYADPGSTVQITAYSSTKNKSNINISFSGYLEDI